MEVLQEKAGSLNVKRALLIKESQVPQVEEFSACVGGCSRLGSLNSFLPCAPPPCRPVACVSTSRAPVGLYGGLAAA